MFLQQNIFFRGKVMRTLSLNASHFLLLKNYRDQSQVETLGRQIFPRQAAYFREAYELSTSKRFGYLLIDVSPHTPEVDIVDFTKEIPPLRTNILPGEDTILYFPEK